MRSPGCQICLSSDLEPIFERANVPRASCASASDQYRARAADVGELRIVICRDCGHIFNRGFSSIPDEAPPALLAQMSSERFRVYLGELSRELVDTVPLRGARVLEVGSGDGSFLTALCEIGDNIGVGFDPAGIEQDRGNPRLVRRIYEPSRESLRADGVVCRHTLEHVDDPLAFSRMLRRACDATGAELLVLEVPNAGPTLERGEFWDFYYDHVSYFTRETLTYLLERAGFVVERIETRFGDQHLLALARPGAQARPRRARPPAPPDLSAWRDQFEASVSSWRNRIKGTVGPVVLWGAGPKAAGFLAGVGTQTIVPYVVDISPTMQGAFLRVGGQAIVAPSALHDLKPALVIVMNRFYLDEVRALIAQMQVAPDICAL